PYVLHTSNEYLPDETFLQYALPHDEYEFADWKKELDGYYFTQYKKDQARSWSYVDFPWLPSPPAGHRPPPPLIQHPLFGHSECRFDFSQSLSTKYDEAQVWLATLSFTDPALSNVQPATVAVKIFQLSRYEICNTFDEHLSSLEDGWAQALFPKTEAWAYYRMRSIQGKTIPWSYGFYKFRLPHGELAIAHVMEYIEGQPLNAIPFKYLTREQAWRMLDCLVSSLFLIHRCGVAHYDIKMANYIVPHRGEEFLEEDVGGTESTLRLGPPIVYIDFNFAKIADDASVTRDLKLVFIYIGDIPNKKETYETWLEDRLQRQELEWQPILRKMLELTPDPFKFY
ncbi:hypothetical protein B0H21DRAFT_748274, partial [Amylocystis lapponica]